MKILISGINGFVGRTLSRNLIKKGYDVYGIDVSGDDDKIYSVDITDFNAVNKCMKKINPDFIYHLAAISYVDFESSRKIYEVNVNGTINLLNALSNLEKIPRFLFISSSQVYGNIDAFEKPISEEFTINPVNHYGASKAAAENIAFAYNKEYNIPLTVLRPFNHIGRGQSPNFFVPKIVNAFREKKTELDLGNINVVRDFLDVRDVVEAYTGFIDSFSNGGIFNLASGRGIVIEEIIKILMKISGHEIKINMNEALIRRNEIKHVIGDYSRLSKHLNWHPKHSIEETLRWIFEEEQ